MNRKIMMVFIFCLFLTACGNETEQVDYDALYEEYYSTVKYNAEDELDICFDMEEGLISSITIDYFKQFDDLGEMIDSEHANFVYGEVFKIEEYNCIADSVYFMVYDTEFEDDRKLIRVSIIPSDSTLTYGKSYILNLVYNIENDVYNLSQNEDAIFTISSTNNVHGPFLTSEYPNELDAFIKQVFKD